MFNEFNSISNQQLIDNLLIVNISTVSVLLSARGGRRAHLTWDNVNHTCEATLPFVMSQETFLELYTRTLCGVDDEVGTEKRLGDEQELELCCSTRGEQAQVVIKVINKDGRIVRRS